MTDPLHLSAYLEVEPRSLADVIALRARCDHARGLKLHQCPFITPRLSKLWKSAWLRADAAKIEQKEYRHVS